MRTHLSQKGLSWFTPNFNSYSVIGISAIFKLFFFLLKKRNNVGTVFKATESIQNKGSINAWNLKEMANIESWNG